MKNFVISLLVIGFGLNYGLGYILSEKFQTYGDQNKAQWTCYVNDLVAEISIMFSKYDRARGLYERVVKRCPESGLFEKARFKIATCFETENKYGEAREAYRVFVEDFPKSKRSKLALKKIDRIDNRGSY